MDSQDRRSVYYGSGFGKIMVEKNKKTEKKDETAKKTEEKKATLGAWWKSTVVKETTAGQESPSVSVTKKVPAKRKARKPSARSATKVSAKPADKTTAGIATAATTEEANSKKTPPPSTAKRSGRAKKSTTTSSAKSSSTQLGVKETVGDKKSKTPRKRTPRKKKSNTPSLETTQSTLVDVTAQQSDKDGSAPLPKKPARKRSPRKSVSKKVESATSADSEIVEEAKISTTGEKKPIKPKPKKRTPRKRAPKKPQAKEKETKTPAEAKQDTSAGADGVVPVVDDEVSDVSSAKTDVVAAEIVQSDSADINDRVDIDDTSTVPEAHTEAKKGTEAGKKEQKRPRKETKEPKPVIKLLINAEEPEECRLALLEDGRLESIHVATVSRAHTKNNIYKARIVAIEANLQAAFVDYGTEKNGFLPFSEIHPEYYRQDVNEKTQKLIDQHQWKRLSIKDVVEKGQEVLVQVVKEEVGTKGANMTTYLSLPGRCVVLMPGSDSTGISRKISGEERRSQLRDYVKSFDIPEGIGWIVRTASIDITKTALSRDVGYLLRLWEDVKKKGQDLDGAGLIYQDHNHVLRFLREHFDPDIQEILVDDKESLEQVKEFVELLPSKQRNVRVKLHRGARPIFNQYSIEDQIESIYQPRVSLPSGGSIVIDPTEALVAIDVNSGSTSKGQNFEASIFQANMEAAKELARQLRLRDLGGLIVIDFIDMRANKNIREVERQVKIAMKRDKAKVDISRISKFGLMQISRQKLGAPIEAGNYSVCTHCKGRGMVRSVETLALYYLRRIQTGATRKVVKQIECHFPLDVAQYLLNYKRNELRDLEAKYNAEVIIIAEPSFKPADNDIIFHKAEKDDPAKKRS